MKQFSLLIKPASADCNLRCPYCFYLSRSLLYPESARHRMSDEVLEKLISSYMATPHNVYAFAWQGGEPGLMGVEFYRKVVEYQQRYGKDGSVVSNSFQTNATLIDDEFAALLGEYRFLVGVSIDGPEEIHDHYRKHVDGRGSHAEVLKGIECLERNNVEFNTLTLVTPVNVGRAKEIYRYFRDRGIYYHQYIPCIEFDDSGKPLPFTVTGAEYGDFLCELFDEWVVEDTRKVSVRLFDSIVTMLVNGEITSCHMSGDCRQYLVVEYSGDIYPCDFFVKAEKKLGNILSDSWGDLQESASYAEFGEQKSEWCAECAACPFLQFCMGDCLKYRVNDAPGGPRSWLCEGWKQFYAHAMPTFERLASEIKQEMQMQQAASAPMGAAKPGRNDPCPCGSGKKFKKCHGAGL